MAWIANVNRNKARGVFALLLLAGNVGCDRPPASSEHSSTSRPASLVARSADSAGGDSPAAAGDTGRTDVAAPSHDSAAHVLRRYYAAINAHDFDAAYSLWGRAASHQSRAQFAAGFAQTAHVRVTLSDSARIEGAAGSQYATIPVTVDATLRDGRMQHFIGTYTLRRAMVTGASEADRRWHIYSAHLTARR